MKIDFKAAAISVLKDAIQDVACSRADMWRDERLAGV